MRRQHFITWTVMAGGLLASMPRGSSAQGRAGADGLPTCTGFASGCADGSPPPKVVNCKNLGGDVYFGRAVIADLSDGVSSDGRGPYIRGVDGAGGGVVVAALAAVGIDKANDSVPKPRRLTVNLEHPVPGGGGVPLGIITDGDENGIVVEVDTLPPISNIAVGQTVTVPQLNVGFHINGRFHLLQIGPLPFGHCYPGPNVVNGAGTSSGTIDRPSRDKWVIDLPAGSVGRLFDVANTKAYAVDKGLYFVRLHYEITNAVPSVASALRAAAATQGGAGVVARYRALKRDSANAYVFDDRELSGAGYSLLHSKKAQDAIIVLRFAVEEYPNSWLAHDDLGDAYLALGDTTNAIAQYKRSLELHPNNQDRQNVLKRLEAKP